MELHSKSKSRLRNQDQDKILAFEKFFKIMILQWKNRKAVEKNVGEGSIYRIKVENLKPKDLGGLMEIMGVVTILQEKSGMR